MKTLDLYVGDVVQFTYQGGTSPGSVRTVLVTSDGPEFVRCWDFDKDDLRTFSRDKIENVKFLDDVKSVPTANLPTGYENTLAEAFKAEGYKTYVTDTEVVAVKTVKPSPKVVWSSDKYNKNSEWITFDLPNGKHIELNRSNGTDVKLFVGHDIMTDELTVEELLQTLSE